MLVGIDRIYRFVRWLKRYEFAAHGGLATMQRQPQPSTTSQQPLKGCGGSCGPCGGSTNSCGPCKVADVFIFFLSFLFLFLVFPLSYSFTFLFFSLPYFFPPTLFFPPSISLFFSLFHVSSYIVNFFLLHSYFFFYIDLRG